MTQMFHEHDADCGLDEGRCEVLYGQRVSDLEAEGMTTSDAQGVADVEFGLNLSRWA